MKLLKLSLMALPLVLSTTVSAGGPPKVAELLPQPFQIILTAEFAASGGHSAIRYDDSEPCDACLFEIDEDKTAVMEYVTCRATRGFGPNASNNYNFRLISIIEDGSMSEMVVFASDMEVLEGLTPSPTTVESSFDMISACIGKNCNSLGDGKYAALTLEADRSSPGGPTEFVHCLISGLMY